MRIAQVAPLHESVPPMAYGGTERIVSYLTEHLISEGHDVTLFASGDSKTRGRLVVCAPGPLRSNSTVVDPLVHHLIMIEQVAQRASEFDIIHFHTDYLHFPASRRICTPHVTTLHGRLDSPDLKALYREFSEIPLVSISDQQRRPLPFVKWIATVHHGIPLELFSFNEEPGDYLAFLGRVSPEKNLKASIDMAKRVGVPLKIAAKVDKVDEDYFNCVIAPLIDGKDVEFLGEIGDEYKNDFLGGAIGLLFPIEWPEPFGIVMIESLACGTPVIAYRRGSVPEVIEHGQTGCIVESFEGAVDALNGICSISRRKCRTIFESRFTAERMAKDYLAVYQAILNKSQFGSRKANDLGNTIMITSKADLGMVGCSSGLGVISR